MPDTTRSTGGNPDETQVSKAKQEVLDRINVLEKEAKITPKTKQEFITLMNELDSPTKRYDFDGEPYVQIPNLAGSIGDHTLIKLVAFWLIVRRGGIDVMIFRRCLEPISSEWEHVVDILGASLYHPEHPHASEMSRRRFKTLQEKALPAFEQHGFTFEQVSGDLSASKVGQFDFENLTGGNVRLFIAEHKVEGTSGFFLAPSYELDPEDVQRVKILEELEFRENVQGECRNMFLIMLTVLHILSVED